MRVDPKSQYNQNIVSCKKLQRLPGNTNGGRPDNGLSMQVDPVSVQ